MCHATATINIWLAVTPVSLANQKRTNAGCWNNRDIALRDIG
jgi:hypothetical protein